MNVFQSENEIKRLNCQEEILQKAQDDILDKYLSKRKDLNILDIGSNDGFKTKLRFDKDNVAKVIGIEYSKELVELALKKYGDNKFIFSCQNVEDNNFLTNINKLMSEQDIKSFDLIHVSLVLLHLNNPLLFIKKLREILSKDGKLIIIEADDEKAKILNDDYYLKEYNKILKLDPLMGNREIAKNLPLWLKEAGYTDFKYYYADNTSFDYELKKEMYEVYFLAVIEDFTYLCNEYKDNLKYHKAFKWLKENLEGIRNKILEESISFGFGVAVFVVNK